MQLIEIESPEQWKLVVNELKRITESGIVQWRPWGQFDYRGWWAGATDEAEEGTWVWTQSGKPVGNFTWLDDQPDNGQSITNGAAENYFGLINWKLWNNSDYRGHDVGPWFKMYPLCQKKR